ncbi:ribosomal protein-like [Oryza sativa Japonica Group]|uniref:Ribosomal protein-like n=1 Tax=Oryza sativa subsp. japonica TaxID=39947 RepID=Q84SF3_ORYSJ|nr:ribosomal protein-like [Oryza sativa Japonica Group]
MPSSSVCPLPMAAKTNIGLQHDFEEWGQFTRGDYKVPTIILEVVASHDLWIWHAFFGVAGSNNDINVLNQSPLFLEQVRGEAPRVHFFVNGNEYNNGYYLADGIYPDWASFMKSISLPQTEKHKLFAERQEGARKDVEQAFGVLQARFNIVRCPVKKWKRKSVGKIMLACVILPNMIVEDEREDAICDIDLNRIPRTSIVLPPEVTSGDNPCFTDVLRRKSAIRACSVHTQLITDLIEHIWRRNMLCSVCPNHGAALLKEILVDMVCEYAIGTTGYKDAIHS